MLRRAYSSRVTRIGIPICSWFLLVLAWFFISAPLVQAALVNINTAGIEELDTLDGIGPAYAQRIIDHRVSNGHFQNIEEIKNVKGIGDTTFLKFKNNITVGITSSGNADQPASTVTSAEGSTSSAPTSQKQISSSHYGSEELTNFSKESEYQVGAGRSRLGVAGGPMEFRAEAEAYSKLTNYKWSFGDGTTGDGFVVSHTYEYPGDYVVVLSSYSQGSTATSRTDVRVIASNVSVTLASRERIEVSNNSTSEINLYGRALISGDRIFAFPKDTIIKAGKTIALSRNVTTLEPQNINSMHIVLVGESASNRGELEKIKKEYLEKIAKMYEQIAVMTSEISTLSKQAAPNRLAVETSLEKMKKADNSAVDPALKEVSQTAVVINSIPEKVKKDSFLEVVKRFFLRQK